MITIVSFKWESTKQGFQLPNICAYTDEHVRIHKAMFERHLTIPHRYVCVTDKPVEGVECIPLWDKCRNLGGCYNRLYTFSRDMVDLFGFRFACVDLDVVLTRNVDHIFGCKEAFRMNSYKPINPQKDPDQWYNGGLYIMCAGVRSKVWDNFDYEKSPLMCEEGKKKKQCIGSDQAWIRLTLGKGEPRFTEADGVYEYRQVGESLPKNACMVFFAGARDPSQNNAWYVKENWKC